jgi:hypothetical protein
MKLQIDGPHLRVRIDEDELARLLAGEAVRSSTQMAQAFVLSCELALQEAPEASLQGSADAWQIRLPADAVRELAGRLPSRDGLQFELPTAPQAAPLTLLFDVDVRDSARRMKAARSH